MFIYKLFMLCITMYVNAVLLLMNLYYVKNVLNGWIVLTQLWKNINEFKTVVHAKRWENIQNKQTTK